MRRIVFIIFYFFPLLVWTQIEHQDSCGCTRRVPLMSAFAGVTSYVMLQQAWYSQYPQTNFHFFNDNNEWLQMDKVGHAFSNYQISRNLFNAYMNTGYDRNKASLYASLTSISYMTGIEVLDGFSSQWGFSRGDFYANLLGAGIFYFQEKIWHEQKGQMKFSYHNSPYAKYNPAQLGDNFQQRILKDYNAQTYWLSFNTKCFFREDNAFSNIFLFSVGYGINGMISAKTNNLLVNNFHPHREFLFSFDADLTQVKWKRRWMRKAANFLSIIKIPMPTLGVSEKGRLKFYPLYF
jgi:hypothetical protein